jgi:hypothetical protein
MISFQHIKSGQFLASPTGWTHSDLLADAYPWAECDEARLRDGTPFLSDYRTVTFSTRIDHPANDLAKLSREQLAERYPIAPAAMAWGNRQH